METLREETVESHETQTSTAPSSVVRSPALGAESVVEVLRRDARLNDALTRERGRADDTNQGFLAMLLWASECDQLKLSSSKIEFTRVPGSGGRDLVVWRATAMPDLEACGIAPNTPLFRYPCDPESPGYIPLETIFFRPTPRWKRTLDLVGAAGALVLLSPLLLVVTLLIKLGSPGPAFFKQRRLGGAGRPFTIWKFRTFRTEVATEQHQSYVASLNQSNQPLRKVDASSMLVPCGRVLRACAIDELPQLFNVLQGTMSLVGPRPDVLDFDDYSSAQRRRFDVVPGMTGLWQVSGKNRTTFREMIDLDVRYVRERSPWLDAWIIVTTLPAMIRQVLEQDSV